MALPRRSPAFYRAVLVLPVLMLAYLAASGRFSAYWRAFANAPARPPSPEMMTDSFVTALLWLAAVSPLLYAAWEIGREHTPGRRLNYGILIGLREVVRRATGRVSAVAEREREIAFARPPADNPRAALAWGAVVGVLVPTFFASFAPFLRTPGALVWLAGTGLLIGASTYFRRRAMAYLREEPGRWDMFREWRLLNPARYDEAGRVFVRWQKIVSMLLPFWWLGGGMIVMWS
jgi:hypothetical protein